MLLLIYQTREKLDVSDFIKLDGLSDHRCARLKCEPRLAHLAPK